MGRIWFAALAFLLAGCVGKPALDDAKLSDREFNLEEFFDGRVVASGQFQDTFGTVRRRFDVADSPVDEAAPSDELTD